VARLAGLEFITQSRPRFSRRRGLRSLRVPRLRHICVVHQRGSGHVCWRGTTDRREWTVTFLPRGGRVRNRASHAESPRPTRTMCLAAGKKNAPSPTSRNVETRAAQTRFVAGCRRRRRASRGRDDYGVGGELVVLRSTGLNGVTCKSTFVDVGPKCSLSFRLRSAPPARRKVLHESGAHDLPWRKKTG